MFWKSGEPTATAAIRRSRRPSRLPAALAVASLIAVAGCSAAQSPPQPGAAASPSASSPAASRTSASRPPANAPAAAGVAPRTTTSTATTTAAGNWPTFGRTAARSSYQPSMGTINHVRRGFAARLDGAVYAQPLLVNGRLIIATENDSIYALSPTTGAVLWRAHLGTPVNLATLPCGNIDPLGITGTPVYDPTTGAIYAVAETTGAHHTLVAVDAATGRVQLRRNVDPPGVRDPRPYQQRAALAVVGRTIYVTYGGLAGDCGNYLGTILGVPDAGTTGAMTRWRPATPREGGMWNPAGPALAPNGHLLVPVGNGQVTGGTFDGSDSLTELTTTLRRFSYFAPSQWGNDNAGDQDLASGSPAIVTVGTTSYAVIVGKSGTAYLTKIGALGGIGGQVKALTVGCRSLGTTATAGATVIQNCPISGQLMAFTVGGGTLTRKWTQHISTWGPAVGGGRVFAVDRSNRFTVFALDTGRVVTSVDVGDGVPHFATPMLTASSAYVGTDHGVQQLKLAS